MLAEVILRVSDAGAVEITGWGVVLFVALLIAVKKR